MSPWSYISTSRPVQTRKLAIANRTAHTIRRHLSLNSVTLKSRLGITEGHWKRYHSIIYDLLLVELFDVKYYGDLEMWVRDHSMTFKLMSFERLGTVFYSP